MTKVALSFCLLLSITLCHGQVDFKPGYIVDLSGDTIRGTIEYRGNLFMSNTCRLKTSNGAITSYSPSQLRGYGIDDSKYYVSHDVKADGVLNRVFLEVLVSGTVNILYFRGDTDRYYIEKDSLGIAELPYSETVIIKDGKQLVSQSTRHIGVLQYYMQDVPELRSEITRMRKLEVDPLVQLADRYNRLTMKADESVYLKPKAVASIYIDLVGGAVFPRMPEVITDETFMLGGQILLGMPRYNEKLFFRTGFIFTHLKVEGYTIKRKIPVAFEYMPMKRRVNLRASYGLNLYNVSSHTISISGGLNVKFNQNVSFNIMPEMEFTPEILLLPGKREFTNIHGGVLVRLK
jgi:hypothetical protein